MSKTVFLYCTGTSHVFSMFWNTVQQSISQKWYFYWGDKIINPSLEPVTGYVTGLNGQNYPWDGEVFNDPFPTMLDSKVWDARRVRYAASNITFLSGGGTIVGGMGASINDGVSKVVAQINALPQGQPFALGGYSQGAAVMSEVYNQIRSGSLTSRARSFLGGVMFGNPRRQVNHRGEIGGTWSGAWDVPGSNFGGHGCFPATGQWARLSGCDPLKWIEFTAPDDIISSTGDTPKGTNWSRGSDALLGLLSSEYGDDILFQGLLQFVFPAFKGDIVSAVGEAATVGSAVNYFMDALGGVAAMPGAGHVIYPALPPPTTNGVLPSISVPVTSTFTIGGATASTSDARVVRPVSRRGKVPTTFPTETYTFTQNYLKPDGQTCYQLALAWLEAKAAAYAVSPTLLSPTALGWSTTLAPPG
jgi:hypothetical protein